MVYSSCTLVGLIVLGWVLWVLAPLISGDDINEPQLSKPSLVIAPQCPYKCGNVTIPYPFGLEEGCYLKEKDPNTFPYYKINCSNDNSTTPPKPIFGKDLELLTISLNGSLRINYYNSYDCYNNVTEQPIVGGYFVASFRSGRFTISGTENILVGMGCDTRVWFSGLMHGKPYYTGCMTTCYDLEDVTNENCNGIGCCQASLPEGVTNITTTLTSFFNHSNAPFNPCSVAFPVAKDAFKFDKTILTQKLDYFEDSNRPVILNWAVGEESCSVAKASDDDFLCKANTICEDPPNQVGYRCKCKPGFAGNPYHPNGCSDIDECKVENDCKKPGYCVNENGGYHCQCPKSYKGIGTTAQPCISHKNTWLIPVLATAGVGGGIITFLVIGFLLHWKHVKRQMREMRDNNFRQNGGFLLYEKLSSRQELNTLKIYTTKDLEIASNNYSDDNIIGRGGFGIVYKGIMTNHQVVAIKKSLKVDPDQVEQFINEVLVLSQIKNKYVVKLLGCCLETEVPLLVYEFINNGTLYEHLDDGARASVLNWPMRLKIASQVANVLSYLHYTTTTPIIHRDIKSMNILLDESYTAKVADFGASRLVPPDQSQFATMVLGTRGYLDPEYLQTTELTEKSDVYSFGVVLVELLTRKKAISNERIEIEKCLAMHFLIKMKEGHLFDILDNNILTEGAIEDIQQVSNLAKWCLMLKGEERPTMKEVAMELETITRKGSHPWSDDGSFQKVCEPLLTRCPRSDDGGCSTGTIESNSYNSQLLSSLENGR